jgi:hypothetical protein
MPTPLPTTNSLLEALRKGEVTFERYDGGSISFTLPPSAPPVEPSAPKPAAAPDFSGATERTAGWRERLGRFWSRDHV